MTSQDTTTGFIVKNIVLERQNLMRLPEVPNNLNSFIEFAIEFEHDDKQHLAKLTFKLELKADEKDENAPFTLMGVLVGVFAPSPGATVQDIEQVVIRSAPGIMFPYLREHINSMSQRAGIVPLVLPPLNMSAALLDADKADLPVIETIEMSE